jgi:WhiB family redox-sensing transcriptional regulator
MEQRLKRKPSTTRVQKSWRLFGSCRDSDPNLFYPIGRSRTAQNQTLAAKLVCTSCPSREPCLAFALATHQELGVWGGTSPEDRRHLGWEVQRQVVS